MEKQVLILDQDRIGRKIERMAYQVWERNSQEQEIVMIGIEGTGIALAESLAARVRAISNLEVRVHRLVLNKRKPLDAPAVFQEDINGRSVVLVDDVANSGKTLLYALRPVLDYEPSRIQIAVLVDRKHKSFPISPDIVGHTVATTLQEHIEVVCKNGTIVAAYLQ